MNMDLMWYLQTSGASGYTVSSVVTARGRLPGALLGTLIVIHHRIDHNQNLFYYFKVVNDASGGGAGAGGTCTVTRPLQPLAASSTQHSIMQLIRTVTRH